MTNTQAVRLMVVVRVSAQNKRTVLIMRGWHVELKMIAAATV
jgi:hypothetical protein